MSVPVLEPQSVSLPPAEFVGETSFGAHFYQGSVQHPDGRRNDYFETVPVAGRYPGSAVVIAGGYMSSHEQYARIQRQEALLGEHSYFVGHVRHAGYEVGHNAADITQTALHIGRAGVLELVLVGHSQGAHEVLDAYEEIREVDAAPRVSDIVLAFPACAIDSFSSEFVKSAPLFAAESIVHFFKNPLRHARAGAQVVRNVVTDPVKIFKEGRDLASNVSVGETLDRLEAHPDRPRVHFVVGLFDGLTSGKAVMKSIVGRHHHDTFTVLRAGHVDFNHLPKITDIIQAKVRS